MQVVLWPTPLSDFFAAVCHGTTYERDVLRDFAPFMDPLGRWTAKRFVNQVLASHWFLQNILLLYENDWCRP
jgi:hypothetical protein